MGNSLIRGGVWGYIPPYTMDFREFIEIYRNSRQKPPIGVSIFSATCPPKTPFFGYIGDI
jgi:hypothetical protein